MKKLNYGDLILLPKKVQKRRKIAFAPVKVQKPKRRLPKAGAWFNLIVFLLLSTALSGQTFTTCNQNFLDDGGLDWPYSEDGSNIPVTEIFTICPDNPLTQLSRIEFNQFDLAAGDTLRIYDGNSVSTGTLVVTGGGAGSGSGSSVADSPGGGSTIASCDNPSGCLTVAFTKNNDNIKGNGWSFLAECVARTSYSFPAAGTTQVINQVATNCEDLLTVSVPIPEYLDCLGGDLIVTIDCPNASLSTSSTNAGTIGVDVPLGKTIVTFTSPFFPSQTAQVLVNLFPKTLNCNDNVTVSLLQECVVPLTPDLILEDMCTSDPFIYEIDFVDRTVDQIGTTLDGFPIVDFSGAACDSRLAVKVKRFIEAACGIDFVDECIGFINITDQVSPVLTGGVDTEIIPCFYDNDDLLDQLNAIPRDGRGAVIDLHPLDDDPASELVISHVSDVFGVVESCNAGFVVSEWREVEYDCTTGAFTGLVANADDPLWALLEVEIEAPGLGSPALFKAYFRVIRAIDGCGNLSNIGIQRVAIAQPDLVSPLTEIEVPCGVDIDPNNLFDIWASNPVGNAAYAAFIPNFDPTPLDVNGDFHLFGGLDDTYFTDGSGDEKPARLDHAACGYAIDWEDSDPIETCNESFKIFREWTAYNWCDGHLELIDIIPQVIKVGDVEAPTLEFVGIGTTGTGFNECAADAILQLIIKDDCSGNVRAYVDILEDNIPEAEYEIIDGTIRISNVPIGELFTFNIRLIDDCGNNRVYGPFVQVLDDEIPPTAICESFHVVSMNTDCTVEVPAIVFDDGSYDNCGNVSFCVARADELGDDLFNADFDFFFAGDEELFKPTVTFTRDDLTEGCTGTVDVVFAVKDGNGNVNFCMVQVELQDKIPPVVIENNITVKCPSDEGSVILEAVYARNPTDSLEVLFNTDGVLTDPNGLPFITVEEDNCKNARFIVDQIDVSDFDPTVQVGKIRIFFQAIDVCGNVSLPNLAEIIIESESDWVMNFPMDAEIFCEDGLGVPAAATLDDIFTNFGCDVWGLNVEEKSFVGLGGVCTELIREYHLINFATWNPSNTEDAIVERPSEMILDPFYTVALRYVDENEDGINDIDDGNEDNDFSRDAFGEPIAPLYLYKSLADRVNTFQPIRIPFTEAQLDRFADGDEATAFDPYDVTAETFDGDFVLIDYADQPYQYNEVEVFPAISQFSGVEQHYVSAQYYGNIIYRQIIRINDNTPPVVEFTEVGPFCVTEDAAGGSLCSGAVNLKFNVEDLCAPELDVTYELVAFTGTADEINFTPDPFGELLVQEGAYALNGTYPIGKHKIVVLAQDGCINTTIAEVEFEVIDCKAPTPYCILGLSTDAMANGEVTLWASDFDAGSFDNCTEEVRLTFADPILYPDSTFRTFRCVDGEIGVVPVELWAQDEAGNTAFCVTFINVQANPQNGDEPDDCFNNNSSAMIAGAVTTEFEESVSQVQVNMTGLKDGISMTGNAGTFQFSEIEFGYDYTITPVKNEDLLNGVSTFDMVLLSKHILGIETFDSPYAIIAGDVNNSGSVTTYDMVTLRKAIIGAIEEFPNNTSWRFIDAQHQFTNPAHPFVDEFSEAMNLNDLDSSYLNADFIAVKVGDVNGSAQPNELLGVESRNAVGDFELHTTDAFLTAGDTRTLDFTANLSEIEGYQFTMNLEGLEIVEIVEGTATTENFRIAGNQLIASWNGAANAELAFSLVVAAKTNVQLRDAIRVTNDEITSEAYHKDGSLKNLALRFNSNDYELAQNKPNPFKGETVIGFHLPTVTKATITIHDLTGKTWKEIQQHFEAGYNEVTLSSKALPSGLLYYTLEADTFTATKKMIVLQ